MIDYAPMWTAEGKPADQRAAPLQNLKPGWTVRLAANGDVERRMPSGQVSGRYGRDALDHAVAEGWLVETRRRGDVVEYAPAGAPVATEAKPETKRRPAKPKRVKRPTRRKAAPAPSASAPRRAEPVAERKPKKRVRVRQVLPTSPPPTADGHECLTVEDAAERWGVTPNAVRQAAHKGRVDKGTGFLPAGAKGRARLSVAVTPRTLAYAGEVWGSADPARWTTPAPKRAPWHGRAVALERGAVLLQGEVLAALGMGPAANNRASRALLPLRRKGHGNAFLYRVDDALVSLLEELGFVVTLTHPARLDAEAGTPDTLGKGERLPAPAATGEAAGAAEVATAPSGDGAALPFAVEVITAAEADVRLGRVDWREMADRRAPIDTPVFV